MLIQVSLTANTRSASRRQPPKRALVPTFISYVRTLPLRRVPMQHSSYWQPGLGCHNLPIDWFDQFIPAVRQKELNAYVYRTVALGGLSLASAVEDARTHLKLPPQEPVSTLEVLQHLLAPALQRRQTLAQQPQPVFANIVACLDRSQCPSLKHTQLINDLDAGERGPTWWIWHWRACEFEKAVKHIEREPPLPSGSQYHSVKTLFVTLKEVCLGI